MYSQLIRLPSYPFVQIGFVAVMITGIALGSIYFFGRTLGRRGANRYANGWMIGLGVVLAADYTWAWASGQWERFGREIGFGAMGEMVVLGAMFLLSLWFMASRYADSIDDIDSL